MITLAITNHNRTDLLFESFAHVLKDDRISEILIMDDCSDLDLFKEVEKVVKLLNDSKIKLIRQANNRGMAVNKRDAIASAKNDWVIIFDSDNVIKSDYLDSLFEVGELNPDVIYSPVQAYPNFIYDKFSGAVITKANCSQIVKDDIGNVLFNTCNYVVHKKTYLSVFEEGKGNIATDTVFFNYLWMKAGKAIKVVPGMIYYHRVHKGSAFMENADYNMRKGEEIRKLIKAL